MTENRLIIFRGKPEVSVRENFKLGRKAKAKLENLPVFKFHSCLFSPPNLLFKHVVRLSLTVGYPEREMMLLLKGVGTTFKYLEMFSLTSWSISRDPRSSRNKKDLVALGVGGQYCFWIPKLTLFFMESVGETYLLKKALENPQCRAERLALGLNYDILLPTSRALAAAAVRCSSLRKIKRGPILRGISGKSGYKVYIDFLFREIFDIKF